MIGVAPEANLLSISIGFGAASSVPFVEQVADAMKWAVDHGADIINLSFTTNTLTWDPSWDDAFQYAFDHDVVVVVAAGNKGSGTDRGGRAATIPGVLTVGGVNRAGRQRPGLDAGHHDRHLRAERAAARRLADGTVVLGRTSGAAPIVAGIARSCVRLIPTWMPTTSSTASSTARPAPQRCEPPRSTATGSSMPTPR
jgi:subtilisin family serine protease